MSAANYDEAIAQVLAHEGGYSNHPSDPAGPTSFGITIHDYRKYIDPNGRAADVRSMSVEDAKRIYREHYAIPLRFDDLPSGADYAVLDYGINSGISRAAKVLQRLVGVAIDGKIGPATVAAAAHVDARKLVDRICDERLAFLQGLSTWQMFGRGWSRRVREVRALAHKMVSEAPASTAQAEPASEPSRSLTSKPMPVPAKIGLWAAIVASLGAVTHWLGDHILLTIGAVVAAAVLAPFLLSHLKNGD